MLSTFTQPLLSWFAVHGRRHLPWQMNPLPYRVWISEIMLQQTQVATVIPYYARFMTRFPDVASLAQAEIDTVLHLWSGLGYYARARHLHQAALQIMTLHQGYFPREFVDIIALPGIGRSTAGAIKSLAMGEPYPILDGNVKRVLSRFFCIPGWPGSTQTQQQLWQLAQQLLPTQEIQNYTQALMDLGALVCTRRHPLCGQCPLNSHCEAYQRQEQLTYPQSKPKKKLANRAVYMLILQHRDSQAVMLQKRPPVGLWGGLWSFPQCDTQTDLSAWCRQEWQLHQTQPIFWPLIRHSFTHFHLSISPVIIPISRIPQRLCEGQDIIWCEPTNQELTLGIATPVKQLLMRLKKANHEV